MVAEEPAVQKPEIKRRSTFLKQFGPHSVGEYSNTSVVMNMILGVVVLLQDMLLSSLGPGEWTMSRADCMSSCYHQRSCSSMFYNPSNQTCHLLDTLHDVTDFVVPSPGVQYITWQRDDCSHGYSWFRALELCFKVKATAVTWYDAEASCNEDGGHLIKVDTAERNSFINSIVNKKGSSLWMGGTDGMDKGRWTWADGSIMAGPTFWYPGEPNGAAEDKNCLEVMTFLDDVNGWNDNPWSANRPFVCEISLSFNMC